MLAEEKEQNRETSRVLGLRANFWAFLIWFSIVTPFLRAHCETANALPLSAISDERTKVHQSWKLCAWLRKLHNHSFFPPDLIWGLHSSGAGEWPLPQREFDPFQERPTKLVAVQTAEERPLLTRAKPKLKKTVQTHGYVTL